MSINVPMKRSLQREKELVTIWVGFPGSKSKYLNFFLIAFLNMAITIELANYSNKKIPAISDYKFSSEFTWLQLNAPAHILFVKPKCMESTNNGK